MNDYRPRPKAFQVARRALSEIGMGAESSFREVYEACLRELQHDNRSEGKSGGAMWRNGLTRKQARELARKMARERIAKAKAEALPRYVPIAKEAAAR